MSDDKKAQKTAAEAERAKRLEEALRANLKRRKSQSRERRQDAKGDPLSQGRDRASD